MNDQTTFFLGFLALFGLITWYLVRLDREARSLEARLALLEARRTRDAPSNDMPANQKKDEREDAL